jgi:hypothetical protein
LIGRLAEELPKGCYRDWTGAPYVRAPRKYAVTLAQVRLARTYALRISLRPDRSEPAVVHDTLRGRLVQRQDPQYWHALINFHACKHGVPPVNDPLNIGQQVHLKKRARAANQDPEEGPSRGKDRVSLCVRHAHVEVQDPSGSLMAFVDQNCPKPERLAAGR